MQFEHPRSCARFVADQAKRVTVRPDGIRQLAKKILEQMQDTPFSTADWKLCELHPKRADRAAVDWIFLVDALNFSFWPDPDRVYSVSYRGKPYTGYWALCAAVNRALDDGVPITEASFYKDITVDQLSHLLRADQPGLTIPLVDQRVQVLHQCAQVLLKEFSGSFVHCIEQANGDAELLLRTIYERFEPFRDQSEYAGKTVLLLKRAQILIADVWACFEGRGLGRFDNVDTLTMFADYRVPQVLVYFDAMHYEPELRKRLQLLETLRSGEADEVEIRAVSIHAVELLRDELLKLAGSNDQRGQIQTINSVVLDFYLWNFRQAHREAIEQAVPFHRVRSINY